MKYSKQTRGSYTYKETTTVDGRDVSREEFRVIPGFTKYEITKDGDVRNVRSGKLLTEMQNKRTGAWSYCLWTDEEKSTHRNWEGLVHLAYPELKPEKPVVAPTRRYARRGGWVDIPGFPTYQMHADGFVRYKISRRRLKIEKNTAGVDVVTLRNDEGARVWTITGLLLLCYLELRSKVEEAA